MPFDGELSPSPAYREAVSHLHGLACIADGVGTNWCQMRADGPHGSHCLIGWVLQYYPPGKSETILRMLHDALPKSAPKYQHLINDSCYGPVRGLSRALTKYNDSHTQRSVSRVVQRAFNKLLSEVEEHEKCQGF